jgi:enoyl-CoA hydratase/carnithine racemase
VDKKGEKQNVGVITLNRPKALNALCNALMVDVNNALDEFQKDDSVGAIVLTGSERAFAAGKLIFYVFLTQRILIKYTFNEYNFQTIENFSRCRHQGNAKQ